MGSVGSSIAQRDQPESNFVRAVQRAMRIVTALAENPYPMGIVEIAEQVELSPASVHRQLATLVSVGWVEQNSRTTKYRIGMEAVGVGMIGMAANPIIQDGKTYLGHLARETGYDAVMSILVGRRTVQVERVAGAFTSIVDFEPGRYQPAHTMADGKLLLAYLPEDERRFIYEGNGLRRYTPNTIVDPTELEQEFEKIRSRGYSVDNYERFEAGRGVAVPVLDSNGRPLAALLCVGTLDPAPDQELQLVRQMLSQAREMSERLIVAGEIPST